MIGKQNNNPIINNHFELQIKTLQNVPRDEDKLQALLKAKEREKATGGNICRRTQRLNTEVKMLKVAWYLVSRKRRE